MAATDNKSHVDLEPTAVGDEGSEKEIVNVLDKGRESSALEYSVEVVDVDLEARGKVHLAKRERECRICHLSFDATNLETGGLPMELGCSCRDYLLAAAPKQCVEAWFKIMGNK